MNRRDFLKTSAVAALAVREAHRVRSDIQVGDRVTFRSGTKIRQGRVSSISHSGHHLARLTHVDDDVPTARISVIPIAKLTKVRG